MELTGISCLALGLLCSGLYAAAQADRHFASTAAIKAFDDARRAVLATEPDQSLWSASRRSRYRDSLATELGAPEGLLKISAIHLTAPVFEGTTAINLNRGVGRIANTAKLGPQGNIGIAGHRDGFFRGLKDLKIGDVIELQTVSRSLSYRLTELMIVDPSDVFVLGPTSTPSITLVTCYPFYFVGHAPQRYIVRGVLNAASDAPE